MNEAQEAAGPSITPARYEPDPYKIEQGGKIGPDLYRLILPGGYVKDGSISKAFGLDRLYADQARSFSNRVLAAVETSIGSLFDYKLSKEDEEEIGKAVGKEYPPPVENPDFRLTTAQVLVATLRAASGLLGPKMIEKARADEVAMGLEISDDQELRRGWASFWQGVAGGIANQLVGGFDMDGEKERVMELEKLIAGVKDEEKQQGEDIKRNIEYGLELREKTADSLRQFGGEVWRQLTGTT